MGISISHGSQGEERRSGLSIQQLGQHLAHVLTARDWNQVRHLFDGSFGGDLDIEPTHAGRIADILRAAAEHHLMPEGWAREADLFANAARRASRAGEPWTWR
ncbi:hypothetical protein OG818_30255 [Streptomyces virginiae]|uniref:DUF7739 domain-containing protein n=1 Tax=Streptomyces virginiae TaxID=1961 RepID=UPI00225144CA|nr:hypothetical protein [Streptomyces virginiae]MCX4720008.1 hypothetical protein [Streptomyces virginiae]